MKKFKLLKGTNGTVGHLQGGEPKRHSERLSTSVKLTGVLNPWSKNFSFGVSSDYKLICANGREYFIIADSEWRDILPLLSWKEIKVIGLLDPSNMTLIPKRIFPIGPAGPQNRIIDMAHWKNKSTIKKRTENVSDWVMWPIVSLSPMAT